MIKSLNVSPDVYGQIIAALNSRPAESGLTGVDILYFSTPLSIDDARRIGNLADPVPIIIDWNKRGYAEIIEGFDE